MAASPVGDMMRFKIISGSQLLCIMSMVLPVWEAQPQVLSAHPVTLVSSPLCLQSPGHPPGRGCGDKVMPEFLHIYLSQVSTVLWFQGRVGGQCMSPKTAWSMCEWSSSWGLREAQEISFQLRLAEDNADNKAYKTSSFHSSLFHGPDAYQHKLLSSHSFIIGIIFLIPAVPHQLRLEEPLQAREGNVLQSCLGSSCWENQLPKVVEIQNEKYFYAVNCRANNELLIQSPKNSEKTQGYKWLYLQSAFAYMRRKSLLAQEGLGKAKDLSRSIPGTVEVSKPD